MWPVHESWFQLRQYSICAVSNSGTTYCICVLCIFSMRSKRGGFTILQPWTLVLYNSHCLLKKRYCDPDLHRDHDHVHYVMTVTVHLSCADMGLVVHFPSGCVAKINLPWHDRDRASDRDKHIDQPGRYSRLVFLVWMMKASLNLCSVHHFSILKQTIDSRTHMHWFTTGYCWQANAVGDAAEKKTGKRWQLKKNFHLKARIRNHTAESTLTGPFECI